MGQLFTKYLHSDSRIAQFMRFATVGVKISAIDAGGVYLLPWLLGMNLYLARVISLGCAIFVGYLLNRYFTFGGNERGCFYRQMAGHFGVHLTGGMINYGVFSGIVTLGHAFLSHKLALSLVPLAGIWIGGMVGLTFNFILSKRLVFHTRSTKADGTI